MSSETSPTEPDRADRTASRRHRGLAGALAGCGLGAVLALGAASRDWLRVVVPRTRPLADATLGVAGHSLAPLVPALGLAGLAALVGLVATRRWGRVLVGAVLLACGLALATVAARQLAAPATVEGLLTAPLAGRDASQPLRVTVEPLWPAAAVVGGLLLAGSGAAAVLRGRQWPGMSGRYDAPADPVPARRPPAITNVALWDAVDHGRDPTE